MILSVATSIDALAVGLSLAVLDVDIWYPAVVIGIVAGGAHDAGHPAREPLRRARFGRRMETVGGIVLLAIGFRILVEHLF